MMMMMVVMMMTKVKTVLMCLFCCLNCLLQGDPVSPACLAAFLCEPIQYQRRPTRCCLRPTILHSGMLLTTYSCSALGRRKVDVRLECSQAFLGSGLPARNPQLPGLPLAWSSSKGVSEQGAPHRRDTDAVGATQFESSFGGSGGVQRCPFLVQFVMLFDLEDVVHMRCLVCLELFCLDCHGSELACVGQNSADIYAQLHDIANVSLMCGIPMCTMNGVPKE